MLNNRQLKWQDWTLLESMTDANALRVYPKAKQIMLGTEEFRIMVRGLMPMAYPSTDYRERFEALEEKIKKEIKRTAKHLR